MARKNSSSGLDGILIIGAGIVFGFLFILPYLLTALFYSFPIYLIWLYSGIKLREQPDIDGLADIDVKEALAKLKASHRDKEAEIDDHIEGGRDDVRFIERTDRFDNRSLAGQALNDRLDELRGERDRIRERIEVTKNPEERKFQIWRDANDLWHDSKAYLLALQISVATFVVVIVWIEAVVRQGSKGAILIWNPLPDVFRVSVEFAVWAALAIGTATLYGARWHQRNRSAEEVSALYDSLFEVEAHETDYVDYDNGDYDAGADDDEQGERAEEWYEVLKVSENADAAEIKKAYRTEIMGCHPDKVASLNDEFKALAKAQTLKLNAAYGQARLAKGF